MTSPVKTMVMKMKTINRGTRADVSARTAIMMRRVKTVIKSRIKKRVAKKRIDD